MRAYVASFLRRSVRIVPSGVAVGSPDREQTHPSAGVGPGPVLVHVPLVG